MLGGAGVDTIVPVPELPLPYADSYMIDSGIRTRAGQTGDFVALGLAALGLRTHHLDLLGDDPEGDLVRALHCEHGIALTALPQPHGHQAGGQPGRPGRPPPVPVRHQPHPPRRPLPAGAAAHARRGEPATCT